MPCECFYGGIREKSIGYPMKVYRVFPESLQSFPKKSREYFQKVYRLFSDLTVQMIRYLPSSVPLLWDNRFASSHPPFRFLRRNALHSPIFCPNISHPSLRYLRTKAPLPPIFFPNISHAKRWFPSYKQSDHPPFLALS